MRKQPAKWIAENPAAYDEGVRSFWLNAFSSPWTPWEKIALKFLQVTTGTLVPTATVVLKFGDHERMSTATGNGPVDAAVSAIKKLINEKVVLAEFLMQAITRGSNDVGRVHVQVECGSRTVHGFGAHTDTTRASIEAFLDALRALNVTEKIEEED